MTEETPKEKLETMEPAPTQLSEEQRLILGLAKAIEEQNARLARMENFLDPKKFDDWLKESLTPLVTNIQKRFESVEARVSIAPSGGGQSGGSGLNSVLDLVGKIADKIQIAPRAGGGFAQEIEGILHENAKDTFKLVQMDLKDMLRDRAHKLGLPAPATATHIVLETQ
jgi:hypothetical protein